MEVRAEDVPEEVSGKATDLLALDDSRQLVQGQSSLLLHGRLRKPLQELLTRRLHR